MSKLARHDHDASISSFILSIVLNKIPIPILTPSRPHCLSVAFAATDPCLKKLSLALAILTLR